MSLLADWARRNNIRVLNIAGNVEPVSPRARAHGITAFVEGYLADLFRALGLQEQPLAGNP